MCVLSYFGQHLSRIAQRYKTPWEFGQANGFCWIIPVRWSQDVFDTWIQWSVKKLGAGLPGSPARPNAEAPKCSSSALGQELTDTLGLTPATVGSGCQGSSMVYSSFAGRWFPIRLLYKRTTSDFTWGILVFVPAQRLKTFRFLCQTKTETCYFFISMDFVAPGNTLDYLGVVGRWLWKLLQETHALGE